MPRKSTRRDFLLGKSAADAVGDLADGFASGICPLEEPAGGAYLVHVARPAMAAQFELFFNAGQYEADLEAALEALDLVESLEQQMTWFRDASELSRINRSAAHEPVEVEPGLFALLQRSLELSDQTGGAFDITAGPLWEVWGFSRRSGRIPTATELAQARESVGSHLVELDSAARTVHFRKPGVRLNLGSIGKGYALDRSAEILAEKGIGDYLFHGGQSSVLARGTNIEARLPQNDEGNPASGWTVGLRHPLRRGDRLAQIRLRDQSLATSGTGVQFFWHQGKRYGHILDPRTGWPAEGLLSATVVAPNATLSDALATAVFVMGAEQAFDFCADRPEIGLVLVLPAKSGGLEVKTAGLDESQLIIS
ncbi:MAG: FAD:protein FMN transferase [Pirellulales bacterium]|nr:FAD:protein FMN transferase [Pirellulales bacterium]